MKTSPITVTHPAVDSSLTGRIGAGGPELLPGLVLAWLTAVLLGLGGSLPVGAVETIGAAAGNVRGSAGTVSSILGLAKSAAECSVRVDADTVASVECASSQVELSVFKAGTGGCTVTSSLPGIDCGGTCAGNFPLSTAVQLVATPDPDSVFVGWGGACSGTGACVVTLDQAKAVTATCNNVPVHTLTVVKDGPGDGLVASSPEGIDCGSACSKVYIEGTQVTLNAIPDSRSVFVGWSGACTGTGPCRVTMSQAKAVLATFSNLASAVTIVKFGNGECTVQSAPEGLDCGASCTSRFLTGSRVRLVAVPAPQSTFAGWGGGCSGTGTCELLVDTDKAISATCSASPAYVLTAIRTGTGSGSITSSPAGIDCGTACSQAFAAGITVTLTATPDALSIFAGWGGACSGTGTCTVSMIEAKAVTATFTDVSQSLSVVKTGTGQGTVTSAPVGVDCGGACTARFLTGTPVRLFATPEPDSTFGGWRGACTGMGDCVVTLDAAKSVTAVFTDVTSTLTVVFSGVGSGTVTSTPAGLSCAGPLCTAKFVTGSRVYLTATPDADSTFAGWQGACTGTGLCTVDLLGNAVVTAVFAPVANTLSVVKTGTGSCLITSSPAGIDCGGTCSASYPTGTVVKLRVTPEPGSTFVRWGGACEAANIPNNGALFVSVPPCRLVDTRLPGSYPISGAGVMGAGTSRSFSLPSAFCGLPSNAVAYSLNATVVPKGPLDYLTLWPTGQSQPFVSTLNSADGRIKANAAIVPAGTGGAVSAYVTDDTDLILDVNGYFLPPSAGTGQAFYPVTPCRLADTRNPVGTNAGPAVMGGQTRTLETWGRCNIPLGATAVSLNYTVVPSAGVLNYLTTWPGGQWQPFVSTLNADNGTVVANAAIVPTGTSGQVNVFVTQTTDVIVDVNGYFAAPGAGGLSFYPVTPCRVADTREATGPFGGPILPTQSGRSFTVPSSSCGIPATAQAYSLNATVVPPGFLGYLTLWPTGIGMPVVSTLNAFDGAVTSNAAIVPAGTAGAVSAFGYNSTHVILDINGYLAP